MRTFNVYTMHGDFVVEARDAAEAERKVRRWMNAQDHVLAVVAA